METDYRKAMEALEEKHVTVYPNGIDPTEGTITRGPLFYSVRGNTGMLFSSQAIR